MDEYEEIPWTTLLSEHRQGRAKTLYVVAGVLVAVVIGFAGIRWVNAPGHGEPQTLAPPVTATTTTAPPVTSEATTTTGVLSEADLMAVQPATAELGAVARAEWFVTDYFTVDGPMPEELPAAFVVDADLPDSFRETASGTSYVEWARAYEVRPTADGYAVSVVFRSLTEEPDGAFVRGPVRGARGRAGRGDGDRGPADPAHAAGVQLDRGVDEDRRGSTRRCGRCDARIRRVVRRERRDRRIRCDRARLARRLHDRRPIGEPLAGRHAVRHHPRFVGPVPQPERVRGSLRWRPCNPTEHSATHGSPRSRASMLRRTPIRSSSDRTPSSSPIVSRDRPGRRHPKSRRCGWPPYPKAQRLVPPGTRTTRSMRSWRCRHGTALPVSSRSFKKRCEL